MHAVYMRSVRSPHAPVGGRYKLKDIRSLGSRADVLSQVHEEDKLEDDYEEDSFCVGESYVEEEEEDEEEEGKISCGCTVSILLATFWHIPLCSRWRESILSFVLSNFSVYYLLFSISRWL